MRQTQALFRTSGVIKPFDGDGRKLGYPTANIEVDEQTKEGLFFGTVLLDSTELPAVIFVGTPTTLGRTVKRAEAHILDFEDRDLYGQHVVFTAEYKHRNNKRFDTVDLLVKKIKQDEIAARKYFGTRLGKA